MVGARLAEAMPNSSLSPPPSGRGLRYRHTANPLSRARHFQHQRAVTVERPNPETYGSPEAGGQRRPAYSAPRFGGVVMSTRPLIAGSPSVIASGRPSIRAGRYWNSPAGRRPLEKAS